ncbi:amino acid decarboxylase, partial [bacterium SM23_31]
MPVEEFRKCAYDLVDWACDYFQSIESYPVLAKTAPGEIKNALPKEAPEKGEKFDSMLKDFKRIIIPGVTHWNHPNFFAYFSITGSIPGILGDFLSTVLNINGMLWKTCPSATELEETVVEWAKKLLGIPAEFFGMITDTASVSTLHALTAAREKCSGLEIRVKGFSRGAD